MFRLVLTGTRADVVRLLLTVASCALAALLVLAALNVLAIGPLTSDRADPDQSANQYSNALLREPGLRLGVVITLCLVAIPVFALVGQCVRLAGPARDRRLAAIRLAGATPGQTVALVAAETGLAGLIGVLTGVWVYVAGHVALHHRDATGRLPLPTDVAPPLWQMAVGLLAIPVIAALAAALVMNGVIVSPLGVVRDARRKRPPATWPVLLVGLGIGCYAALRPLMRSAETDEAYEWLFLPYLVLLVVGPVLAAVGILLSTAPLSYVSGRILHRFARRPAPLLAARRLMADPWHGSRSFAVLLVCVLFAGGTAWAHSWAATRRIAEGLFWTIVDPGRPAEDDPFYARTVDLIDAAVMVGVALAAVGMLVTLVDSVANRRRSFAMLTAAGVPRAVLSRSIVWQAVAPAIPAILIALATGASMMHGVASEANGGRIDGNDITLPIPVPWGELAQAGGVALVAVLLSATIAVLFIRPSVDIREIRAS